MVALKDFKGFGFEPISKNCCKKPLAELTLRAYYNCIEKETRKCQRKMKNCWTKTKNC